MKLDRSLQLKILNVLAEVYPEPLHYRNAPFDLEEEQCIANIYYLLEHGLVSARFYRSSDTKSMRLNGDTKITAKGMDFLADDGGLSAVLGTVTIKFHEETLKELIELRINSADLPKEEKSRLVQSVRELPAESIKHLTTRLLDLGMDNLPRAVELIRTVLT